MRIPKDDYKAWINEKFQAFRNDKAASYIMLDDDRILVYNSKNNKTGISRKHPDDFFDKVVGIAIAYARMKDYEVPEVEEVIKPCRVDRMDWYFSINSEMGVYELCDFHSKYDNSRYEIGNYFITKKRAEEVAEKVRLLLRLEQLHDVFCPDYVVGMDSRTKHGVYFDVKEKRFKYCYTYEALDNTPYFSTSEIAKKVCKILNKEYGYDK